MKQGTICRTRGTKSPNAAKLHEHIHAINTNRQTICIRQQNTNKSLISQLDLLMSLRRTDYDICLIQKPYVNFKGMTQANVNWTILYPTTHTAHPDATRAVTLINTRILSDTWTQIPIESPNMIVVIIQGEFGTMRIVNIYNDCNHNKTLKKLATHL